jgi:hypothetical protein
LGRETQAKHAARSTGFLNARHCATVRRSFGVGCALASGSGRVAVSTREIAMVVRRRARRSVIMVRR